MWNNNLVTLENVTLPRCYKPKDFGKNIMYSLQSSLMQVRLDVGRQAKASNQRMENEKRDIHCCLIFGKSRVAPVKYF